MLNHLNLPDFEAARVIVYGDLMLDRYWYGSTSRISPEAPVPVVNVKKIESKPGGAANVALNIAALGGKISLFGLVGDDAESVELKEKLNQHSIDCQFLALSDYSTITKLRVLGQNQQLIRMDFEKVFDQVDDAELIDTFRQQLNASHIVVLSDYAKGTLQHIKYLIELAREQGVPVVVDPKSKDFSCYAGAMLVTPNLKEFKAVVGEFANDDELAQKAFSLMARHQIEALLITRGKDGMTLVHQTLGAKHYLARSKEVYDVTGAGDTVIAVIAAALAAGHDIENAVNLGNIAAGIVVGKLGAEVVSVSELRRALQRKNNSHFGVMSEKELLLAVADAKAHAETIVMTNGCFDILHAGHVQYLEQAKKLGKRLIVAINDDDSVRRLKGHQRPINPLEQRMDVIAGLRAVDWVVAFSEDTPARLIKVVNPDVLVKGGDYRPEEIAGADSVIANGGQVKIISLREGCSTSSLVEKIKEE